MPTEQNGSQQEQEVSLEQLQEENLRLKREALQKENELLKAGVSSQSESLAHALRSAMSINSPDGKLQAHGKTVGEMKLLKEAQARGEKLPTVKASNGKSDIREDEQHLVHVYLETVLYSEKGIKVSPPGRVQKFDANDFTRMTEGDRNHFGQYDIIDILHDPRVKTGSLPVRAKRVVTEQSVDELKETYRSLYGEDAEDSMSVTQLMLRIREAQA